LPKGGPIKFEILPVPVWARPGGYTFADPNIGPGANCELIKIFIAKLKSTEIEFGVTNKLFSTTEPVTVGLNR
jgi:hypothetical protein